MELVIDGSSLTPRILYEISKAPCNVTLAEDAWERVRAGRKVIDKVLEEGKVVYGINTGFGELSNVQISKENLSELQVNLVRSHAAGVGEPLTPGRTRMLLTLRINVIAKGYSGLREETLKRLIKILNADVLPFVPQQGTVGASGDLAPLAHLALSCMGESMMWDPKRDEFCDSAEVLKRYSLEPIELRAKEGLALINGTQMMTSLACESVCRASNAALNGDLIASMTNEALLGTIAAYDERIQQIRNHTGQIETARRLRGILLEKDGGSSELRNSHANCGRVQDCYTLRCVPQVHGVVHDTLSFVHSVLSKEANAATDNPLIFAEAGEIISGGNFHGEYPAKMSDILSVAIFEVANMSERRIERLTNSGANEGLPAFLVKDCGLNSGFMIPHCVAASLVSENKVLVHPASCDSLPTSMAKEDHVSMGGFAARKSLQVVTNVENVLAIELLAASQAIELRRPLTSSSIVERVLSKVREKVVLPIEKDRYFAPDIEACSKLIRSGELLEVTGIGQKY